MANMILACCETQIPTTLSLPNLRTPKPKSPFPTLSLLKLKLPQKFSIPSLSLLTTITSTTTFLFLMNPHAALVEEFEKAALFDINLTFPIIMVEFLLLMVALDKIYFIPVYQIS